MGEALMTVLQLATHCTSVYQLCKSIYLLKANCVSYMYPAFAKHFEGAMFKLKCSPVSFLK